MPGRAARGSLADGLADVVGELREAVERGPALLDESVHDEAVVLAPALRVVETPRLEELLVVDARDGGRDLVTEIVVCRPRDRSLRDALHDGGRERDLHLLGAADVLAATDAPGVHQEGLDRV